MDWLISIAENLASNVIWKILGALATTAMIAWLVALSRRGKVWAVIGASVFVIAVSGGAYIATRKAPPDRATSPFAILVADLNGDADRAQTHHIRQSLETQFNEAIKRGDIEILMRGETLTIPPDGNLKMTLEAAASKGRAWLKEQHASVLIWGEAAVRDKLVRVRFLPAEGDGSAKSYALSEQTLELPVDFGGDLGAVFAAQAATAISPVYDRSGEALANLIAPFVDRLKPLAEKPPASFSDGTRAQLWHAYAAGEKRLGEEQGDNARLASAIAFYQETLTIWTRDKVPLDWAMTQNNLGNALSTLGERESGTTHLEEAVAAYRAALLEYSRDKVPLNWAGTQNNLGAALSVLGERESGTARQEEAVAAYREALLEWTRDKVPLNWAMTQNNLGIVLRVLGEREAEADKAKGCATLKAAREHYEAALEEFRQAGASYYVEKTQGNIARLDGVIGRLCG